MKELIEFPDSRIALLMDRIDGYCNEVTDYFHNVSTTGLGHSLDWPVEWQLMAADTSAKQGYSISLLSPWKADFLHTTPVSNGWKDV